MKTDFKQFTNNILNDLRVELTEEFDRNFERKSFFGVPWAPTKLPINRGSLMIRTGGLRQSIGSRVTDSTIVFSSSLPYASIHNEGGKVTVTAKMKSFFWAMYYKATGALQKDKRGVPVSSKTNVTISAEAMYWKGLALMKLGSKVTIPKRQFLGHHPAIDAIALKIVDDNVQELAKELAEELRGFGKR